MPSILNNERKVLKAINKFFKYKRANHRYASFDYCYNYFFSFKNKKLISSEKYLENSCLHLVSYLASWGMYRGSSFLLKEKSARHFIELIKWISSCPKSYWEIDVENYNEQNIKKLLKIYNQISDRLNLYKKRKVVLVTKIILGVFGSAPAFDNFFQKTFSRYYKRKPAFTNFNKSTLEHLKKFYDYKNNAHIINKLRNKYLTYDFKTGEMTIINYTQAKIIDMIGFGYSYKPKKRK